MLESMTYTEITLGGDERIAMVAALRLAKKALVAARQTYPGHKESQARHLEVSVDELEALEYLPQLEEALS